MKIRNLFSRLKALFTEPPKLRCPKCGHAVQHASLTGTWHCTRCSWFGAKKECVGEGWDRV